MCCITACAATYINFAFQSTPMTSEVAPLKACCAIGATLLTHCLSTHLLCNDKHIECFACNTVPRPMQAHLQPGLRQIELYLLLSKPGVVLLTYPPLTCCCFLLVAGKQGVGNLASLHLHLLICIFNDVQQDKGTVDSHHEVDARGAVPICIHNLNVNVATGGFSQRHLHLCCEIACTPLLLTQLSQMRYDKWAHAFITT